MRAVLFLLIVLRIVSYFILPGTEAYAQPFKLLLRAFTTGVCTVILLRYSVRGGSGDAPVLWRNRSILAAYMVFLYVAASSLLYTTSLATSLLQLAMYLESLLFAYLLYRVVVRGGLSADLPGILNNSIVAITGAFLVGAIIAPGVFYRATHGGEVSRLGGFIINPNELGLLIVIGIACGVVARQTALRKRGLVHEGLAASVLAGGLLLTSSRSSLIALLLTYAVVARLRRTLLYRYLFIIAVIGGGVLGYEVVYGIMMKQGDAAELVSLTGRLPFWRDLVEIAFPQRPILGYGFQRIWYDDTFPSPNAYAGGMAHNTFLQVLLGLGVIGFSIAMVQVALTVTAAWVSREGPAGRFALTLLVPTLMNSLTEFGAFGLMNYGVTFYQIAVFVLVMHPRHEESYEAPTVVPIRTLPA